MAVALWPVILGVQIIDRLFIMSTTALKRSDLLNTRATRTRLEDDLDMYKHRRGAPASGRCITANNTPLPGDRLSLEAFELTGDDEIAGYSFQTLGEAHPEPFALLGQLTQKMKWASNRKRLQADAGRLQIADMTVGHLVKICNEKDRQTLAWLRRLVGDAAIALAVQRRTGSRKPYLSAVCRRFGCSNTGFRRFAAANVESNRRKLVGDDAEHPRRANNSGETGCAVDG